jgi:hypothetical protein
MVMRAEVPRTAVLSVPAYGVNVHSEHEVVVAGTAWRGWDAWSGKAPTFRDVPMDVSKRVEAAKPMEAAPETNPGDYMKPGAVKINITPEQQAGIDKIKADKSMNDLVHNYKAKISKDQQL